MAKRARSADEQEVHDALNDVPPVTPSPRKRPRRRDANATVRAARAIELRIKGYSYSQIADECGYSDKSSAYNAVKTELDRTIREPAEALRTLEGERLDAMWRALYPMVTRQCPELLPTDTAEEALAKMKSGPSLFGIDRAIAIQERRAQLFGLNIPVEQGAVGVTIVVRKVGGVDPAEV